MEQSSYQLRRDASKNFRTHTTAQGHVCKLNIQYGSGLQKGRRNSIKQCYLPRIDTESNLIIQFQQHTWDGNDGIMRQKNLYRKEKKGKQNNASILTALDRRSENHHSDQHIQRIQMVESETKVARR